MTSFPYVHLTWKSHCGSSLWSHLCTSLPLPNHHSFPPPCAFTCSGKYKAEHDLAVIVMTFHVCTRKALQSVRSASPGEGREWREKEREGRCIKRHHGQEWSCLLTCHNKDWNCWKRIHMHGHKLLYISTKSGSIPVGWYWMKQHQSENIKAMSHAVWSAWD